jgi:hypothetical protein
VDKFVSFYNRKKMPESRSSEKAADAKSIE